MKLKKVVSLALAGVMAVSMLAGCATKAPTTDKNDTASVAGGYSAEFAKYVDEDVAALDYVSFADNAADVAALKNSMGYFTDTIIQDVTTTRFEWIPGDEAAVKEFVSEAGISDITTNVSSYGLGYSNFNNSNLDNERMNESIKMATAFVADGTMDLSKALKLAADEVNGKVKVANLLKSGEDAAKQVVYDYHYTVSVSVASRATTTNDIMHDSVNVIVVTITRTGTPHNY